MSWGIRDIPRAKLLWRQIILVCGGTWDNRRQTCRAFYLGVCQSSDVRPAEPAQERMPCGCFHWLNLNERQRRILIAARAGMPTGLIALLADDDCPQKVAALIMILQGMADIEPLKAHVEHITERVPMWGERPAAPALEGCHAAGL